MPSIIPPPLDNLNISFLVKLGSIARHVEEYISSGGHQLDIIACDSLLKDPEIHQWMQDMDKLALLPLKR